MVEEVLLQHLLLLILAGQVAETRDRFDARSEDIDPKGRLVGVLRDLLDACTRHAWRVDSLVVVGASDGPPIDPPVGDAAVVTVEIGLTGPGVDGAPGAFGALDGVLRVGRGRDGEDED